jgi:hypothetical protein
MQDFIATCHCVLWFPGSRTNHVAKVTGFRNQSLLLKGMGNKVRAMKKNDQHRENERGKV